MAYPGPPTTPPVPDRGDRATFSNRVDAFLIWVAAIIPWLTGYVTDFMATLTTLAAGGANSFRYVFDSNTSDGDPGPGNFRMNSVSQSLTTILYIDTVSAGTDITQVLAALVARTSTIKGTIRLQKFKDLSAWMILDVTGFTVGSGYYKLNVAVRASTSTNPFSASDSVVVFIEPSGEKGANGTIAYAEFADIKPTGTSGGSAGGSGITLYDRTLNTVVVNEIPGASLSGNNFTLPAGSYQVSAHVPGSGLGNSRAILFNVTDGVVVANGNSWSSNQISNLLVGSKFTITSPKVFKIQMYSSNGASVAIDFGPPTNQPGVSERYSDVSVWKIT